MKSKWCAVCGLGLVLLSGCGVKYETFSESSYYGGTVTNVYGETYITHSGSGMSRTSYRKNECHVTVGYDDGQSETFIEDIEPVYCYKLQTGDWVDGWEEVTYRRNLETNTVEIRSSVRRVNIAQEIAKRIG